MNRHRLTYTVVYDGPSLTAEEQSEVFEDVLPSLRAVAATGLLEVRVESATSTSDTVQVHE